MPLQGFVRKEWRAGLAMTCVAMLFTLILNYAYHATVDIDRPVMDETGLSLGYAIDHPVYDAKVVGFPAAFYRAYAGGFAGAASRFDPLALLADFLLHLPIGFGIVALMRGWRPTPKARRAAMFVMLALVATGALAAALLSYEKRAKSCAGGPCDAYRADSTARYEPVQPGTNVESDTYAGTQDATPFMPIEDPDRQAAPPCTAVKGPATGHEGEGWKTYVNEAYCFSFRYPGTWTVREVPAKDSVGTIVTLSSPETAKAFREKTSPYGVDMSVAYWPSIDYEAARGGNWMGTWQYKDLSEYFTDPSAMHRKTGEITIDGRTADEVILGGFGTNYGVMMEHGGVYMLAFSSADKQSLSQALGNVLATFRFLD
ncbi:MAG TPA: hypothetical protein VJ694_02260 [Patescibacteria group bacterium]|nr:hypothetical protein [Patescibacteria group bacterium]